MRTLEFKCTYTDFLDSTGRRDSKTNQKLWLEVVALVNAEHYDMFKEELCDAVALLANDDI